MGEKIKKFLSKIFCNKKINSTEAKPTKDYLNTIEKKPVSQSINAGIPKISERDKYISDLISWVDNKVSYAMENKYKSTRIKINECALEHKHDGIREKILSSNPYVLRVSFKLISSGSYIVLHLDFVEDENGNITYKKRF